MKNCPMVAEFHADGQTVVTKLIVPFRSFANAPKSWEEVDIDGAAVLVPRNAGVVLAGHSHFLAILKVFGVYKETR
jgi:hypothetical protein